MDQGKSAAFLEWGGVYWCERQGESQFPPLFSKTEGLGLGLLWEEEREHGQSRVSKEKEFHVQLQKNVVIYPQEMKIFEAY